MAISVRDRLRDSFQKMRDSTTLDERVGSFVNNRLKPIGQNFQYAASNLASPQVWNQNINNLKLNTYSTRRNFEQNPLSQNKYLNSALDNSLNSGQSFMSGMEDVYKGTKSLNPFKVITGVGRMAAPLTPVFQAANLAASSPNKIGTQPNIVSPTSDPLPNKDQFRRFSRGILQGMTGIDEMGSNVQLNKSVNLPFDMGSFDPYAAAGSMYGYTKNPVNQKLFKATERFFPSNGNVVNWITNTAVRGGLEEVFFAMSELPENSTVQQKAQFVLQRIPQGVLAEFMGQGIGKGFDLGGQGLRSIDDQIKLTETTKKQMAQFYDQLDKTRRYYELPVKSTRIDENTGERITMPLWKTILTDQTGSFGGPKAEYFKEADDSAKNSIDRTKLRGDQLNKPNATLRKQFGLPDDPVLAGRRNIKPIEQVDQQQAQQALTGSILAEDDPSIFKKIFANYVGKRDVANTTATDVARRYANLPTGPDTFKEFVDDIEGVVDTKNPQIKKASKQFRQQMDEVYKEAKEAGVPLGYVDGYVTHFWDKPREEVKMMFDYLKKREFFQTEREVPTYDEGIKMGLKPKYDNVALLAQDYIKRMETLKANLGLLNDLKKQGLVVPASIGAKTPGFQAISAPGFPKNTTSINGKVIEGFWYAPDSVVKKLNRVFAEQDAGTVGKIAEIGKNVSGRVQDIALSGGLPGTPLNAFSLAQAQKEVLSGRVLSPIKALFRSRTTKSANEFFQKNVESLKKLQERNVPIRTTYSVENFVPRGTIKRSFGEGIGKLWNLAISDPTFKRFMPALQIQMFNEIEKASLSRGKSAEEAADIAAKAVKNFYGVIGSDDMALRSKVTEDTMGALFFAPKFRESMINFWANNIKGLSKPLAPENINNTKFLLGSIIAYGVMTKLNKEINGQYMHENPQYKEDKLLIPLNDGTTLGIPYLSSIATVPRGVYRTGKALLEGDPSRAAKDAFQTFGSMTIKPIGDLATNQNYFGQEIYDPDASTPEKVGDIVKYLVDQNTPGALGAVFNLATKKEPAYQALSKAFELPLRFYSSESIANAPFWEEYNRVKKIDEKSQELKYSDPQKYEQYIKENAQELEKKKVMSGFVKAYYEDNKNSNILKQFNGQGFAVGNNIAVVDGKVVDIDKKVQFPKFTGESELDKKLISDYRGELTSKTNDIVTLYNGGILSKQEAEKRLQQIEIIRDFLSDINKSSSGSGKKLVTDSQLLTAYRKALQAQMGLSQPVKASSSQSYGDTLKNRARNFQSVI